MPYPKLPVANEDIIAAAYWWWYDGSGGTMIRRNVFTDAQVVIGSTYYGSQLSDELIEEQIYKVLSDREDGLIMVEAVKVGVL